MIHCIQENAFNFNLRPYITVGQIAIMGSMPVILEYVGGGFGMPAVLGGASHGNGRAVQVDPIKPTLKAPGINLLTQKYYELFSTFA